ncbi:hypothetical protein KY285_020334 [Solanum tuberosum]|nr:hypothetical protein KY285_020334 [Solanum tuberosum]
MNPKTPIYSVRTYYINGPKSDPKWANGRAKSGSPNRSAMCPIWGATGTLSGLGTIAQSTWQCTDGLQLA